VEHSNQWNLLGISMNKHALDVWSPQLRNRRQIDVYLPPSYESDPRRRYPVVYMHDGQNLSDPFTAFGGTTWRLGSALERLASRGLETIVVGIHNMGEQRIAEYTPFVDAKHGGGRGDRYVRFLADVVKPKIDSRYRTRTDRDNTAILGSSLGGLISLYAFFLRPSPFGRAAVMSPSIWFGGRRILDFVEHSRHVRGRLYLDVGTEEGAGTLRDARALARILRQNGYRSKAAFRYVEANPHRHQEHDWARRLPGALEFVLWPD
jgi:predicted alpha/beta superfamily hydrolase